MSVDFTLLLAAISSRLRINKHNAVLHMAEDNHTHQGTSLEEEESICKETILTSDHVE
jgi:hypothetical protein